MRSVALARGTLARIALARGLSRDYFLLVATHPRAPVQVSGVPS